MASKILVAEDEAIIALETTGRTILTVRDDGIGYTREPEQSSRFGTRLINLLAEQGGATIKWSSNGHGTCFVLKLPAASAMAPTS